MKHLVQTLRVTYEGELGFDLDSVFVAPDRHGLPEEVLAGDHAVASPPPQPGRW